jgi:hypothetical protein
MKFTPLALIALLFSVLLPANFAHADNTYAEAYAVGSNGSTTFQSTFTLNQQPYIYVQFYNAPPVGSLTNETTFSVWQNPSGVTQPSLSTVSSSNQLWISFTPSEWNSIKKVGTWDTTQFSFSTSGVAASPFFEQASFKVTAAPEPVGTVLFLTGALIMGISILRRNKAIVA